MSNFKTLLEQIDLGLFPIIEFIKNEEYLDFEIGMRAKCTGYTVELDDSEEEDTVYKIYLDFSEFKELNAQLEKSIWYGEDRTKLYKWSETKSFPQDCKTYIYLCEESDCYKLVDPKGIRTHLFEKYQQDKKIWPSITYIEWLESIVYD